MYKDRDFSPALETRLHTCSLSRSELSRYGVSRCHLEHLLKSRLLIKARHNSYVRADLPSQLMFAARAGGRVTSTTLFQLAGAWRPTSHTGMHLAIGRRLPRPGVQGVICHNLPSSAREGGSLMMPFEEAIGHLMSAQTRLQLAEKVAIMDSVMALGVASPSKVRNSLELVGSRVALHALRLLNPQADSGIESLFRVYLRGRRVRFREQVKVGHYRVDFLVGNSLVIELVGAEEHTKPARFELDVTREAWLYTQGFTVLRFSGQQVMFRMDEVAVTIDAALRTRRHQLRRR